LAYNFSDPWLRRPQEGRQDSPTRDPLSASAQPPGDDRHGPPGPDAGRAISTAPAPAEPAAATSDKTQTSPAHARFISCRWQQPAEEGNAAFCTHREVKPYAGTTGFDPDAWCGDCQYYKLRRTPKKRTPADDAW
jgi:hypothetical protein